MNSHKQKLFAKASRLGQVGFEKTAWNKRHHDLYRQLKKYKLTSEKFMLMVSGGADSVAGLKLWSEVIAERSLYSVFHYHHGDHQNQLHRSSAHTLVQNLCRQLGVAFFSAKNTDDQLVSEAQLRQARYEAVWQVMSEQGIRYLVTAHHADDLLETRLIRLIRGSGDAGFQSISVLRGKLFRPWLGTSKQDLCHDLYEAKTSLWTYLEDPTNKEHRNTLRNWLRNDWLPRLEQMRPGSTQRLASSFELISKQLHSKEILEETFQQVVNLASKKMNMQKFSGLETETQKRIIARIYQRLNQKNFSSSGILEVMKQLDKTKEGYTFKVQGLTWLIGHQYVIIKT